uniref:Uncharacterized protein n=1 Tax=Leersia perrieri TaxID=77586 RepID=A0A0D9XTU8_9ORYZ
MFHVEMSCKCGKSFDEKKHTTIFYRPDAGSPQTTKIKSFAELPVLYDGHSFFEDNCENCGCPKNIDVSSSDTHHFFTIGLDWSSGCENQVQLFEILVGIAHPLDIKLLYKGVHSLANYSLASMVFCKVFYATSPACLILVPYFQNSADFLCRWALDQDKWLICDAHTVEALDSWEQLHERFRDTLQPEVLFFEVIK